MEAKTQMKGRSAEEFIKALEANGLVVVDASTLTKKATAKPTYAKPAYKAKAVAKVEKKATPTGETFDGEKVVNVVKVSAKRFTQAQNGYMVNFNSIEGKKNYCVYVKKDWAKGLSLGEECKVSLHISKTTGKTSHAIHIGRKATCYASAN